MPADVSVLLDLCCFTARESRRHRGCRRRAAKRKLSKSAVCCENDMMSVSLHYG